MREEMRSNYRKFYQSLDQIAPRTKDKFGITRTFFGYRLKSKKAIVKWVKTFPQLDSAIDNYREVFNSDPSKQRWDMALVLWISALKQGDYIYADRIRKEAANHGVMLSKFPGNIFMRTP